MKKALTLIALLIAMTTYTYSQSDGTDSCINLGHINWVQHPTDPMQIVVYADSLVVPFDTAYEDLMSASWKFTPTEAVLYWDSNPETNAFQCGLAANIGYDSIHVRYIATNSLGCTDTIEGDIFFNVEDGSVDSVRTAEAYARTMGGGSTNISNYHLESDITVYPNPAFNVLNISVRNLKYTSATIYDYTGKITFKTKDGSVSLDNIPVGIYFIRIETDKGYITKKIVKQ